MPSTPAVPRPSSSTRLAGSAATQTDSRPRNRRPVSSRQTSSIFNTPSPSPSRGASPRRTTATENTTTGRTARNNALKTPTSAPRQASPFGMGLLEGPWAPSWSSVTELASSFLSGVNANYEREPELPPSRRQRSQAGKTGADSKWFGENWGPEPPDKPRPQLEDVAAGSMAKREARLMALKTASVLESHEGVNGGLDVAGKFKRRGSDEDLRGSTAMSQDTEEFLVYLHHVQPGDTYAGVVLRYKCREDVFRKSNGLWSRDNIQTRKWLALPVDACEVKGRPCESPLNSQTSSDLLTQTSNASSQDQTTEFFENYVATTEDTLDEIGESDGEGKPWKHARWVMLDTMSSPVEIVRMSRKALGYFPPRRKKNLAFGSGTATPRESLDLHSLARDLGPTFYSPGSQASRRLSSATNRSAWAVNSSTPPTAHSREINTGDDEHKPAWMHRPGGVGSLTKATRTPGPANNPLNSWTRKHLPAINIDSMPSMSVMGSESARFGFDQGENPEIVENSADTGRNALSSTLRPGSGLEQAAAAVETWLRNAFTKAPDTPILRPAGQSQGRFNAGQNLSEMSDLIELADNISDDGPSLESNLPDPTNPGSSSMSFGSNDGMVRGRTQVRSLSPGKAAD